MWQLAGKQWLAMGGHVVDVRDARLRTPRMSGRDKSTPWPDNERIGDGAGGSCSRAVSREPILGRAWMAMGVIKG